jgi:hypothetical protein
VHQCGPDPDRGRQDRIGARAVHQDRHGDQLHADAQAADHVETHEPKRGRHAEPSLTNAPSAPDPAHDISDTA